MSKLILPIIALVVIIATCHAERNSDRWRLSETLSSGGGDARDSQRSNRKAEDKEVTVLQAEEGRKYQGKAEANSEFHYVYVLKVGKDPDKAVRVRTTTNEGKVNTIYPLRVEVRYHDTHLYVWCILLIYSTGIL